MGYTNQHLLDLTTMKIAHRRKELIQVVNMYASCEYDSENYPILRKMVLDLRSDIRDLEWAEDALFSLIQKANRGRLNDKV